MANTFVTMQNIAREALPILKQKLVMPALIHKDYSADFVNQGDTIQIKKPPVFEAEDFSSTINIQDTTVEKVDVTIDKLSDVSVEMTSKELALDIKDFNREVTEPMAKALAQKINTEGLQLAKDIPYTGGTPGTTPDALDDIMDIREGLNEREVPDDMRRAVWNVEADAKLGLIDNLTKVNESASTAALRKGQLGEIFGIDNYYSQGVYTHTAGGATAATAPKVNGVVAAGATTMNIDATAMTGKLEKGDLFLIGGAEYVVTAQSAAASSNAITGVTFYPASPGFADNADITFVEAANGGSVRNLGFHRNAFAWVTRQLPSPAAEGAEAYTVAYDGITLRVVKQYSISAKKTIMSMDILYGYKTIYPELAHSQLG